MSLTFVQGDTGPDIVTVLHEEATPGNVINLTNCTVRFQMRRPDDRRFTVNAPATIVNAAGGVCRYSWGANDLSVPGDYQFQWEVTYQDQRVITTAPVETLTVRRQ